MSGAQYARLVPKLHRSRRLPKIDRPWRPRMVAWAGPSAFYNNRFYEQDKWYKARIDKPEKIPQLHIIDPANHSYSLAQFLEQEKGQAEPVNIGYRKAEVVPVARSQEETSVLEKKSRKMELLVDTSTLSSGCDLAIFRHFNIFDDLFGKDTFFENVQNFEVSFGNQKIVTGNVIPASETVLKPQITISSVGKPGYNTLIMVSLDGNGFENEGELVHWMVTNISDGDEVSKGTETAEYIQALPFSGTGNHRIAFILFRHAEPIEVASFSNDLPARVTSMKKFYKQNEQQITPSGIHICQTSFDDSVREKLQSLGLKSPVYEYEYTEALKPAQKEFPVKPQPFDLYLDMYREPKEIELEQLEEWLRKAQMEEKQPTEWLDINYNENKRNLPAWQHQRLLKKAMRAQAETKPRS